MTSDRPPLRLAMWSGPRNVSTALMRSWGNRPDTVVCDEPLYAHYLLATGAPHPGAGEVIARGETDWRKVVARLTGPVPEGKAVFYQKHMAHHLLPRIDRRWLEQLTHAFLIRDPREVLISLARFLPRPGLSDTGLPQQVEIFESVRERTGRVPPVIDARDLLREPERLLRALCEAVGVAFSPAMLSWPPGRRETDGVWARHWYGEVERSTTFRPWVERSQSLPAGLEDLCQACLGFHERLARHRLA